MGNRVYGAGKLPDGRFLTRTLARTADGGHTWSKFGIPYDAGEFPAVTFLLGNVGWAVNVAGGDGETGTDAFSKHGAPPKKCVRLYSPICGHRQELANQLEQPIYQLVQHLRTQGHDPLAQAINGNGSNLRDLHP